jgi:Arc/MetJ-type ribon-helix-helix transcriptional regulator
MATKQHNVRLPGELAHAIDIAVAERGYASASAFIRDAIQRELRRDARETTTAEIEERLATTVLRLSKDVRAVHTAQLATFAYVDGLTKVFLTCIAEPPNDVLDQARARAKRRYEKFLISVAQGMIGESRGALQELSRVDS